MPPDFGISYIKRLFIATLKNFRGFRKFSGGPWLSKAGICSRQDAKNAKSGSLIFFAAFARDIPSFGCGSAALG
jgi:hypothetical protein